MNIYVGNLSFDTDDAALRTAFEAHGEVTSAQVITDRDTGRSRGFGFVEMPSNEEAKAAMTALDGSDLDGRTLKVNEAKPRGSGGGGGGGRSGGGGGRGGYGGGGGGRRSSW